MLGVCAGTNDGGGGGVNMSRFVFSIDMGNGYDLFCDY